MHEYAGNSGFVDEHTSKHNFFREIHASFGYSEVGGVEFDLLDENSLIDIKDSHIVSISKPPGGWIGVEFELIVCRSDGIDTCVPDGRYRVQKHINSKKSSHSWTLETIDNTEINATIDILRHGVHKEGRNMGHLRWVVSKSGQFQFTYAFWKDACMSKKGVFPNCFKNDTIEYCIPSHFEHVLKYHKPYSSVYFAYKHDQHSKQTLLILKGIITECPHAQSCDRFKLVLSKPR